MIEVVGYLGTALLTLCALPLLFATKRGDAFFLICWFFGECLMFAYTVTIRAAPPLLMNYGLNAVLVAFIWLRRARR